MAFHFDEPDQKSYLDLEHLSDMFGSDFSVTMRSSTEWTYHINSGEFAGYTVKVDGTGFDGSDRFSATGLVTSVTTINGDGISITVAGLHLSIADFLADLDLNGEHEGHHIVGGDGEDHLEGGQGNDIIDGNGGNDRLAGGDGDDQVNGGTGNDQLYGGAGNDRVCGGDGNDMLAGGLGNDYINGGGGTDTVNYSDALYGMMVNLVTGKTDGNGVDTLVSIENVIGSTHNDTLIGNDLANVLWGGAGNDSLFGGGGNDHLLGGGGDDILQGQAGNDCIDGGEGNDQLFGGDGNDMLTGGFGNDYINGGGGCDTVNYADAKYGMMVNLNTGKTDGSGGDTLVSIENVIGSRNNDTLIGNAGANSLQGGGGNDTLIGGAGNDKLNGGEGNDLICGGVGNDCLTGGAGADTFRFGKTFGSDKITDFQSGQDVIDLREVGVAFKDLTIAYNDGNALITTAQGTIVIAHIEANSLHASDFLFV